MGVPANPRPVGMAQTQTNAEDVGCWAAESLGSRVVLWGVPLGTTLVKEPAKRPGGCHPNGPQGPHGELGQENSPAQ